MNPFVLTGCALLQVAVLWVITGWETGLAYALAMAAIYGGFAFTRERWDAHVDMMLLMAGPGGLGMMAGLVFGPSCHVESGWAHYGVMSAGMMLVLPWAWRSARCLQQARSGGYLGWAVSLDLLGMQSGMALAHLPMSVLPASDLRGLWLQHGLMLVGMVGGMLAGMMLLRLWLRQPVYDDPRLL